MGVRCDGGDKSCLRGQSSHGSFEELGKHDIVWISTEAIDQSLSGNVFDNVFLVIIPHCT